MFTSVFFFLLGNDDVFCLFLAVDEVALQEGIIEYKCLLQTCTAKETPRVLSICRQALLYIVERAAPAQSLAQSAVVEVFRILLQGALGTYR